MAEGSGGSRGSPSAGDADVEPRPAAVAWPKFTKPTSRLLVLLIELLQTGECWRRRRRAESCCRQLAELWLPCSERGDNVIGHTVYLEIDGIGCVWIRRGRVPSFAPSGHTRPPTSYRYEFFPSRLKGLVPASRASHVRPSQTDERHGFHLNHATSDSSFVDYATSNPPYFAATST